MEQQSPSGAATVFCCQEARLAISEVIEFGHVSKPRARVLVVPGWGMHAEPYAPLASALALEGVHVACLTLPGHGTIAGTSEFTTASATEAIRSAFVRLGSLSPRRPVAVVAESAGASFAIAALAADEPCCWALLAPGVLPRMRQLLSWQGTRDAMRLLIRGRMPILGWRLDSVSSNPQFVSERRSDPHAMAQATRQYVWVVARSTVAALLIAPRLTRPVQIWHGTGDQLLNPWGSRILARRIGSSDTTVRMVPGADHGLVWDAVHGPAVSREVGRWIVDVSRNC